MKTYKFKNSYLLFFVASILLFLCLPMAEAYAFNNLKNGFETLTESYLLPLSKAIAGCSFIYYVTVSFFRQEDTKKAGHVTVLAVLSAGGLELIDTIMQSFS
ncbi:MAG: hypothetical protein WD025_07915 [Bacteriovoracaceae bacterium]